MKTLFSAEEINGRMVLSYIKDYPDIVNGKVMWWELQPIDLQLGTVGKVVDGELVECKLETVVLNMTEELKTKMLDKLTWSEVDTLKSGQTLLFPPDIATLE